MVARYTMKNTVISPNFHFPRVEILRKGTVSACGNTWKLGEITVFFTVLVRKKTTSVKVYHSASGTLLEQSTQVS